MDSGFSVGGRRRRTRRRPKSVAVVRSTRTVCASDLAKIAICEQKLVFDNRFGERLTGARARQIRHGSGAHARFLRQAFTLNPALRSSETKPWCFIASTVFGADATETRTLRTLRDQVLRHHVLGRLCVHVYYRVSPALANSLATRPRLTAWVAFGLRPVVSLARWLIRRRR